MASIIYDISKNGTRGIGYDSDEESTSEIDDKPKTLYFNFFLRDHKMNWFLKKNLLENLRKNQKIVSIILINMIILHLSPSLLRTLGVITIKGPKRLWVPKDKIIYGEDIFSSSVKTLVMIHGL